MAINDNENATDGAWTAARCLGLLEPLRKHLDALSQLCEEQGGQPFLSEQIKSPLEDPDTGCMNETNDHEHDDRNPQGQQDECRPKKKVKHTYTKRGSSNRQNDTPSHAGQDAFSRCIVDSHVVEHVIDDTFIDAGLQQESDCLSIYTDTTKDNSTISAKSWLQRNGSHVRRRDVQVVLGRRSTEHRRLVDGIYLCLSVILEITRNNEPIGGANPRTLFSTCLQHIAQCMLEERSWSETEVSVEGEDITSSLYHQLEAFGPIKGKGWLHLRQVVRFHALHLLSHAAQAEVLTPKLLAQLIFFCIDSGAHDEAQFLVENFTSFILRKFELESNQPNPGQIKAGLTWILDHLYVFALKTRRFGFLFQQTRIMLERDLPICSMDSCLTKGIWNQMIRSVCDDDQYAPQAIAAFLALIRRSYGGDAFSIEAGLHKLRLKPFREHPKALDLIPSTHMSPRQKRSRADAAQHDNSKLGEAALASVQRKAQYVLCTALSNLMQRLVVSSQSFEDTRLQCLRLFSSIEVEALQAQMIQFPSMPDRLRPTFLEGHLLIPILAAAMGQSSGFLVIESGYPIWSNRRIRLLEGIVIDRSAQEKAVSFLSKFGMSYNRLCGSEAVFGVVQDFLEQSLDECISSDLGLRVTKFLGEFLPSVALRLGTQSNKTARFQWATLYQRRVREGLKMEMDPTTLEGPAQKDIAFRWEEGIEEWVAKPPGCAQPYQNRLLPSRSQSYSDCVVPTAVNKRQSNMDLGELSTAALEDRKRRNERLNAAKLKISSIETDDAEVQIGRRGETLRKSIKGPSSLPTCLHSS